MTAERYFSKPQTINPQLFLNVQIKKHNFFLIERLKNREETQIQQTIFFIAVSDRVILKKEVLLI